MAYRERQCQGERADCARRCDGPCPYPKGTAPELRQVGRHGNGHCYDGVGGPQFYAEDFIDDDIESGIEESFQIRTVRHLLDGRT